MSKTNESQGVLAAFAVLITLLFAWYFISNEERHKRKNYIIKKLRDENYEIKMAYLDLLQKYLIDADNLPSEVLSELNNLKDSIDQLDSDTHLELNETIKLVTEGKESKAIRELAKIVENKLKEKVVQDEEFKKKPMLNNLLVYAKEKGLINSRQFENCDLLRSIRNQESHELAVKVDRCHFGIAVLTGIEIIYSISKN